MAGSTSGPRPPSLFAAYVEEPSGIPPHSNTRFITGNAYAYYLFLNF